MCGRYSGHSYGKLPGICLASGDQLSEKSQRALALAAASLRRPSDLVRPKIQLKDPIHSQHHTKRVNIPHLVWKTWCAVSVLYAIVCKILNSNTRLYSDAVGMYSVVYIQCILFIVPLLFCEVFLLRLKSKIIFAWCHPSSMTIILA